MTNLTAYLENEISYQRSELSRLCEVLGRTMTSLSHKLADRNIDAENLTINGLGEIQGQASAIDSRCGQLAATIRILTELKNGEITRLYP